MSNITETFRAKSGALGVKGLRRREDNPNRFRDSTVPLGGSEVSEFEGMIGERFPEEYRKFLLDIGGAFLQAWVCPIEIRQEYGDREILEILYGGKADATYDLWTVHSRYKDRLPDSVIIIGENLCGDQFCMAIKGPERGKIYFWDHETAKVYLTANSFEDFLNRLGPDPGT